MSLLNSELCHAIHQRAHFTRRIVHAGVSSKLGILEESITDINLIELQLAFPNLIVTKKFSRRTEGNSSGADWFWSFVSNDAAGRPQYFSLAIQAKIEDSRGYVATHYRNKKTRQLDLLLDYARTPQVNAYPLYAVYTLNPAEPCAILLIPAQIIAALPLPRGQKMKLNALRRFAFPIESLFCDGRCDDNLSHKTVFSAGAIQSRVHDCVRRIASNVEGSTASPRWDASLTIPSLMNATPLPVRSLTRPVRKYQGPGMVQVIGAENGLAGAAGDLG